MRSLLLTLLAVPVLLGANQAHALNLCARIDQATGEPRDGASIKLRSQCRDGETAIGTAGGACWIHARGHGPHIFCHSLRGKGEGII